MGLPRGGRRELARRPPLRRPVPRGEARRDPRALAIPAVAGAAVVAAVVAASLAARHAQHPESSPVTPAGSWGDAWAAALVAGFALYVLGVWLVRRGGLLSVAVVVAVAVQLVPLGAPLLLSKDAYLYWSDARIVTVHHGSPYDDTGSQFPDDPAVRATSEEWRSQPAAYGPTWEALALAPGAAAGTSARRAVRLYKVLAALGVLATLALVALRTRSAWAVALLGWNPLLALHFAGGAHNDSWMMALICAAVLAGRRGTGGAAWSLAGAFKPVGGILLPLDLAASRFRRPARFWLGLAATTALVLAGSAAAWGTGWIRTSLVGVHATSPLGGVHWLTEAGLSHRGAVVVGGLVFAAVYATLLVRAWRDGRARLSLAATALCLTTSLLRPWYGIWPLALAAVEEDALAAALAVALGAYLLLGDAVQF